MSSIPFHTINSGDEPQGDFAGGLAGEDCRGRGEAGFHCQNEKKYIYLRIRRPGYRGNEDKE